MIEFIKSLFMKRYIGYSVLKPWQGKRFASNTMTPRYDHNGEIYMLVCDLRGTDNGSET